MSWLDLENAGKQKLEAAAPTDDEIMIAKIFKGEHGPKALDALRRMTIEKPSLQAMFPDGMNTAIAMAVRNGENNLYFKILSIIKKVDNAGTKRSRSTRPTSKSGQ